MDVLDIAIITFIIYKILGFIRETRAEQLLKGLLVLIVATVLSDLLKMAALHWLLIGFMQFGVIALVVVFQPELRRALEYVGRSKILTSGLGTLDKDTAKSTTSALVKAVDYFSSNKIGALIIIEQEVTLNDFSETGTILNSDISTELLENIFYVGSPLHDGAAIIRGEHIHAAGCVLPLSRNKNIQKELGTRHRAGIGITEVSDCLAIIVSEETGIISCAQDGKLDRFLEIKTLEKKLLAIYLEDKKTNKEATKDFFNGMFKRNAS
ncbi:MAG: diadenylate cyclase CdaA [Clostridiales Family XIII bacterium]|nr:diadenylate cyclase CdaA [Clostridiales Family XIII bacterium]